MKYKILLVCIAFFTSGTLSAQWSVGARFGGASGVSLKSYSKTGSTHFEIITAYNFDENVEGPSLTILGEKFGAFTEDGKLGALLGVGETMVFGDDFLLGLSGILGFDWRIGRIGVQLDWLPTWIFINDSYFSPINAAFTARWMFGGRRNP
ncbi:MAG TPA: hypothetical protein VLA46_04785 [Saprospiraceae bacterium]|nr:hypothetical protein [Saprospiraceae bacterium]